jgi:hypothetical protein
VKRKKKLCISVSNAFLVSGSWTEATRWASSFFIAFVATPLVEVLKSKCDAPLARWEGGEREAMGGELRRSWEWVGVEVKVEMK